LKTILYGSSSGGTSSDLAEADIDLEWAGAVAPNATLIYVYGASSASAALYAIDQNLAPVISVSFGGCEAANTSASAFPNRGSEGECAGHYLAGFVG
jgi:subtilase family serine protease